MERGFYNLEDHWETLTGLTRSLASAFAQITEQVQAAIGDLRETPPNASFLFR